MVRLSRKSPGSCHITVHTTGPLLNRPDARMACFPALPSIMTAGVQAMCQHSRGLEQELEQEIPGYMFPFWRYHARWS